MKKIIIEARVNEYAMRDGNPHVPWTADEIAETAMRCWQEGASILHFHARGLDGSPEHSVEAYAEIISKVREKCDILLLPTLGYITNAEDPIGRITNIVKLAEDSRTKPEIAPIMMGSLNLDEYNEREKSFTYEDVVYISTTETLQYYAKQLRLANVKPKLSCWTVGAARRAGSFLEMGLVDEPAYILFHLTDDPYITGVPGTPVGLEALLSSLPEGVDYEWVVNILGGNLIHLAPYIIQRGGHLAVGLGDYSYKEFGKPTNEELVRMIADMARANGREIASPADVRKMLKLS